MCARLRLASMILYLVAALNSLHKAAHELLRCVHDIVVVSVRLQAMKQACHGLKLMDLQGSCA